MSAGPRLAVAAAAVAGAVIALAMVSAAPAFAQSPDELLCQMASEAAVTANAAGPVPIDAMTTQEHIEVTCDTRTILARFSRKDASTAQPAGWQQAWQDKLDGAYCGDPATREVIAGGWTLAESTTFSDGVVFEIKAACE
jgi:hypothetical protein